MPFVRKLGAKYEVVYGHEGNSTSLITDPWKRPPSPKRGTLCGTPEAGGRVSLGD